MPKAIIAGVGITEATASHRQTRSREDLCRDAVMTALDHAGVEPASVDAVVVGGIDGLEPTGLGARHIVAQLGLGSPPVFLVSCGGQTGASLPYLATHLVQSGDYERVVCLGPPTFDAVVDFQKTLETITTGIEPPLGTGAVHVGAMFGAAYQQRHGIDDEDIARVAVHAHHNSAANPFAHLRNPVTIEEVLGTRVIATPLRVGMVCPVSSSAVALVVTSEAVRTQNPRVEIVAVNSCVESGKESGRQDVAALHGLTALAPRLYAKAGITDPRRELDVAETFAPYATFALMQYEALGLCGPGDGPSLLRNGALAHDGELPVNLSGGPLCTNAGVAAELAPFAYVTLQLMGQAPGLGVEGARRGLAHSMGSTWFMGNTVGILERTSN